MFCGDIIRQVNDNQSEPEKFFLNDGNDTISHYQVMWKEYVQEAEKEIATENAAQILAYDPVCAGQDIQIKYF